MSFERERSQLVEKNIGNSTYFIHFFGQTGNVGPNLTTSQNHFPWTEGKVTKDNLTPNYWKILRKKRELYFPVNEFHSEYNEIVHDVGRQLGRIDMTRVRKHDGELLTTGITEFNTIWSHNAARRLYSDLNPSFTGGYPEPDSSQEQLLQKALAQAKTHSWDFGTFAAELNKTADLTLRFHQRVLNRAYRVRSALRKRSGRSKTAPDRFRRTRMTYHEFSNAWLEYRYGWRILGYDIENMAESYYALGGVHTPLVRATAFDESVNVVSEDSFSNRPIQVGSTTSNQLVMPGTLTRRHEFVKSYRAGVGIEMVGRQIAFIDPLVTGYELIPFSFVVDWFTNLGEAVSAWSPFAQAVVKHGFVTTRYQRQTAWEYICPSNVRVSESSTRRTTESFGGILPCTTIARNVIVHRVPALPSFNLGFRLNLSAPKLVDLIALAPALGGSFKPFLLGRR